MYVAEFIIAVAQYLKPYGLFLFIIIDYKSKSHLRKVSFIACKPKILTI